MNRVYVVVRDDRRLELTTVEGVWSRFDDAMTYVNNNSGYGVEFFIEEQRVR